MKAHVKKKWVEALRSGKYKQTTGGLKDNNGYCCLGVLCDLYRKTMKKGDSWTYNKLSERYIFKHKDKSIDNSESVLTEKVMKWAGLNRDNPIPKGRNVGLVEYNDIGKNFMEIADIIEKGF